MWVGIIQSMEGLNRAKWWRKEDFTLLTWVDRVRLLSVNSDSSGSGSQAFDSLLLFSLPVISDSLQTMDCSTPDPPILHHLPEFAQVHIHCIGDAGDSYLDLNQSFDTQAFGPRLNYMTSFSNSLVCRQQIVAWDFSASMSAYANSY